MGRLCINGRMNYDWSSYYLFIMLHGKKWRSTILRESYWRIALEGAGESRGRFPKCEYHYWITPSEVFKMRFLGVQVRKKQILDYSGRVDIGRRAATHSRHLYNIYLSIRLGVCYEKLVGNSIMSNLRIPRKQIDSWLMVANKSWICDKENNW